MRGTYWHVTNEAVAKDTRDQTDSGAGRVKSQLVRANYSTSK